MKYKDFSELPVYKKAWKRERHYRPLRHLRKRIYELVKKLPAYEEYNLKLQTGGSFTADDHCARQLLQ